jgi:single-stranded-DNA-specific exonuclease
LTKRGHIRRDDLDLRFLLDLVALGTVADVMPLNGNNRVLVFHGLRQMSKTPREGLRSLIRMSRIRSSQIRSDHIAYQLAPRLNAAGRLGEAGDALDLLVAEDRRDSMRLAERLDQLSQERRLLETSIVEVAKRQAEERHLAGDPVLVVAGEGWHRGVLGIVAARIVEWSGKPAFIIGVEDGMGIGSARGRGQINLHQCLSNVSQYLLRFGGHRDAAGFTVAKDDLESLKRGIIAYAQANWIPADAGDILCDAKLDALEVTADLLKEISRLGPFGTGNPEPVFEVNGLYVLDSRVVGTEHLKLELKTPTGSISAFGPRMGEYAERIPPLVRVAANLTPDEWRGDGTPELRLVAPPVQGT